MTTLLKGTIMRHELPLREKSTKKAAPAKGAKAALAQPGAASSRNKAPVAANGAATGANKTRQRILDVATQEFSAKGYDGARIDDIVRLSKVSKNLIYHYFGSKEKLFIAVLEQAYQGMHEYQMTWPLDVSSPIDGIRKLVRSTFNYWRDSPEFIGLLNLENFHKGKHLRKSKLTTPGYGGLLRTIANLMNGGARLGAISHGFGLAASDYDLEIARLQAVVLIAMDDPRRAGDALPGAEPACDLAAVFILNENVEISLQDEKDFFDFMSVRGVALAGR